MKILILVLFLAGCSTIPKPVVETHVITKNIRTVVETPDKLLVIPQRIKLIDLSIATQKDVALFLTNLYKRSNLLEERLISIRQFQLLKLSEITKLNDYEDKKLLKN